MKARVKATGDIIEVERIGIASDIWALQSDSTVVFDDEELDINIKPDYWEKLKHQYAGMVMQGILSNNELFKDITDGAWPPNKPAYLAERCDEYATALVNRLKKESQCEK